MATRRLPKQMDPKEYVLARRKESLIAEEQKDDASNGLNHLYRYRNRNRNRYHHRHRHRNRHVCIKIYILKSKECERFCGYNHHIMKKW